MDPKRYYRHSGVVPPRGVVYMLLFGALGATLAGVLWGFVDGIFGGSGGLLVYVGWFLAFIPGVVAGGLVVLGAKVGKVRNTWVVVFVGLLAGLLTEYVQWVIWLRAFEKGLAYGPFELWATMQSVAHTGLQWTGKNGVHTDSGGGLYFRWIVEGLMIVAPAPLTAYAGSKSLAFCEHCCRWAEEKQKYPPLHAVKDRGAFKSHLEQGDISVLKTLKKSHDEFGDFTEVHLTKCPACEETAFLNVDAVRVHRNEKRKKKREEETLLQNLVLSGEQYRTLNDAWTSK